MKTIVKAVLAACVAMLLLVPTHAAAQWVTYSMSGIVEQGRDDLNLFFGEPGETVFLGGAAYAMSLTFDTADLPLGQATGGIADYAGANVTLSGALTMNGKTLDWTTDAATAAAHLERATDPPSPAERQNLTLQTSASSLPGTGGRSISAAHEMTTFFWPLLASTELDQAIAFPPALRDAVAISRFAATAMGENPALTTWFDTRATSASWTVSAVPEPGPAGMLAAGVLTLVLLRRWRGGAPGQRPCPAPPA